MWNARLDEAEAWVKIAGSNIKHLRYTDDTTIMAENKEELKIKSLRVKVKEDSEKASLNLTFRKLRSWQPVPSHHVK